MPRLFFGLAALLAMLPASSARAALPVAPDQVAYSGVLVDGGGAPLAGPVDLTARIYDAASGGALVFVQSFAEVALSDGHYSVNLGPTGAATDSPANPLTTSLRTALVGDLAAGPGRFVEITVDTDPPLARVALVLVPYALRADHAATSDVATNALDTASVVGLDGAVLTELYEHYNEDGGPPASDPSEGTADPDLDGDLNFVDADNDNDGLSDSLEGSLATNINLVTPRVTGVAPSTGSSLIPTLVTVQGTGFLSGLSADFGSQQFSPGSVSSTSFQVTLAPEPAGTSLNLLVTNPNGEAHSVSAVFGFGTLAPVPLPWALAGATKPVSIVARGEELLVYGTQQNNNRYALDTIADGNIAFDVTSSVNGTVPSAYGWSPTRVMHGLRAQLGNIHVLRDGNGDNLLTGSTEAVMLESPGGTPKTQSPSVAFDAAGRAGGGYVRNLSGVQTAIGFHDRNGDGSFTGINELVAIEGVTGAIDDLGEAAFDAAGHLAYAYGVGSAIRLAWDRSGDGDFGDTVSGVPELSTVTASVGPGCLGLAFDAAGRLAIVNGETLFRDLTGDGDFADAGEAIALANACDVAAASQGNRIAIARLQGSDLRLLADLTDDGDFADANEDVLVGTGISQPIALALTASGGVRVLTPQGVVVGPIR